jgi:Holliday junction resolvase
MGINSRDKGKRGEREAIKVLFEPLGFSARRGIQSRGGGKEAADIECEELQSIHFEVKRGERLANYDWLSQAEQDANAGQLPVVLHRKNRQKWVAILDAKDFMKLLKRETE